MRLELAWQRAIRAPVLSIPQAVTHNDATGFALEARQLNIDQACALPANEFARALQERIAK